MSLLEDFSVSSSHQWWCKIQHWFTLFCMICYFQVSFLKHLGNQQENHNPNTRQLIYSKFDSKASVFQTTLLEMPASQEPFFLHKDWASESVCKIRALALLTMWHLYHRPKGPWTELYSPNELHTPARLLKWCLTPTSSVCILALHGLKTKQSQNHCSSIF